MPIRLTKTDFRKSARFGWLAGLLMGVFLPRKSKPDAACLKKVDFPASTQKIAPTMSDKIRDVFRRRWIRQSPPVSTKPTDNS